MAKAKELDRSRYFLEVWGDDEGRCFQQDGVYFDGQGQEWKPQGEKPAVVATPKTTPAKPTTAAAGQVEQQLAN